jgi:hypothetical protein
MPPQSKRHKPIAFEKHSCLLQTSPLVRTSAVCSSVGVYSRQISSPLTLCLKKWCCTSMCLVRSWNSGLHAIAIVDWLSTWSTVGESRSKPSLMSNHLNQTTSFVACAATMYSASVLERVTEVCFFELQLTTAPPNIKTKPDVDLQLFTSLAQSASTKPCKTVPPGVPHWKTSLWLLVALRYRSAHSRARWWSAPGVAECRPRAATVYVRSGQVPSMGYMLPSPRPWDFPPSIDGDISRADSPMELDDPE